MDYWWLRGDRGLLGVLVVLLFSDIWSELAFILLWSKAILVVLGGKDIFGMLVLFQLLMPEY